MSLRRVLFAALFAGTGFAVERPVDPVKHADFASGAVMAEIMALKEATFNRFKEANVRVVTPEYPEISHVVPCVNGVAEAIKGDANHTFLCSNIDLYHFKSHTDLGSRTGAGSSSWGWTSEDGREFIAMGQADGAAFIEILSEGKMVYLGRLPAYSKPTIWREIRGYKNYMIIGSEAVGHNVQVFDMEKLLDIDPATPKTFSNAHDLTSLFTGLPAGRTHNVVVSEESDFFYAVGAQPRNSSCQSGLIMVNMTDPANPTSPGCASEDGYTHDAQCLIYRGPHRKYAGKEICYAYNEDALTIWDMEDKLAPRIISKTSYDGVSYCHQGWVLDKQWQEYLIMDDEYDEVRKTGPAKDGKPVSYIWDIRDLEHPKQTGHYKAAHIGIDHNQYIWDGFSYQSNYGSGFRILDVRSIPDDPTGKGVKEVAFFDIYPEDDHEVGGGSIDFCGSWSSYGGFESGFIFVNTMERGAFLLKAHDDALE